MILFLLVPSYVHASNVENFITSEKYVEMMNSVGSKYGAAFTFESADTDAVFLLTDVIKEMKEYEEHLKESQKPIVIEPLYLNDIPMTRAANINISLSGTNTIHYGVKAYAAMEITVNLNIEPQHRKINRVNSISSRQNGNCLNFVSWAQTGSSSTISPLKNYVTCNATGRVRWSWPVKNGTKGYTETRTLTRDIYV